MLDANLEALRRYVIGQIVIDLRVGDGDAVVLGLDGGLELLLRPMVIGGRAVILPELRAARPDDA